MKTTIPTTAQLSAAWPGLVAAGKIEFKPTAAPDPKPPRPRNPTTFIAQFQWCRENKAGEMPVLADTWKAGTFTCWVIPGTCSSKTCTEARKIIETKKEK